MTENDGNLVIYSSAGTAALPSGSNSLAGDAGYLTIRRDENEIICNSSDNYSGIYVGDNAVKTIESAEVNGGNTSGSISNFSKSDAPPTQSFINCNGSDALNNGLSGWRLPNIQLLYVGHG